MKRHKPLWKDSSEDDEDLLKEVFSPSTKASKSNLTNVIEPPPDKKPLENIPEESTESVIAESEKLGAIIETAIEGTLAEDPSLAPTTAPTDMINNIESESGFEVTQVPIECDLQATFYAEKRHREINLNY